MPPRAARAMLKGSGVLGGQVRRAASFHTASRIRAQYLPMNQRNIGDWSVVLERYTHTGATEEDANKGLPGAEDDFRWNAPVEYDGHPFITSVDGVPPKVQRLSRWLYDNLMEPYNFSRHYSSVRGDTPLVDSNGLIHPGAQVMGQVSLHGDSTIGDRCIIRGWDSAGVHFDTRCHVGEGTIIEAGIRENENADQGDVWVGDATIIGSNCVIRGPVSIGSEVLIGDNVVIEEGAVIGDRAVIGANSIVLRGQWIPDQEVWAGNPAKVIRPVGPIEFGRLQEYSRIVYELHRIRQTAETEYGSSFISLDKKIAELTREMQQNLTEEWVHRAPRDLQEALTPYDERGVPTKTWCDRANDAMIPHQLRGIYEDLTYAKHKVPGAQYQS